MRKLQFLILTGILTISISCGQQKRYVSYKIKEGETMEFIAKRLKVSTNDLLRLNPDVGKTPLPNTMIVIPNPKIKISSSHNTSNKRDYVVIEEEKKTPNDSIVKGNTEKKKKSVFQTTVITGIKTHTVEAGETVYRITKKYNISKEDLIKLNPEYPQLENNELSIGQILKIKTIQQTLTIDEEEIKQNFITHTVRSKETVYGITHLYNISKEDLVLLNPEFPEIKNDKLDIGQLLKIKKITHIEERENFSFYRDSIQENTSINLTLLLPFKTEEFDTLAPKKIFRNSIANLVTDFYMGAEIAVDSLRKQGIEIHMNVFDTGTKGDNISEIIAKGELEDQDIIIGPFYSEKVTNVSKATDGTVVFPHFSIKQESLTSSKVIKTAPDKDLYADFLTSYLQKKYGGETIFIVGDNGEYSEQIINLIDTSLRKHDSISEVHILKPEKGYIRRQRFTSKMDDSKPNWVIIASEKNLVIRDALNSMIGLPDNASVQVFAIDKNEIYDRIDNKKLADIDFTYVSETFVDQNSKEVKAFYKKFKKRNHNLPSDYAIKGFDVTYDILMRFASGKGISKTLKEGISLRVENKFDYRKKFLGPAENKGLFIVKYNKDLSLKKLE